MPEKTKHKKALLFALSVVLPVLLLYASSFIKENTVRAGNHALLQNLLAAYPEHLAKIEGNYLVWKDGARMEISDSVENKPFNDLLENPSLIDQFKWTYNPTDSIGIKKNCDPGRIRYMPFFKKMYGETKSAVEKNLVEITWMPKTVNEKLRVTSVNGVDKKLTSISEALDEMPHLKQYLENPGGTYNWRTISGTNRLSMHSFGMTIDINVRHSNYWQWDCNCTDESVDLNYRNRIPMGIVKIFEKHGFIWGGRWYHYDTMHFEYRPELLRQQ